MGVGSSSKTYHASASDNMHGQRGHTLLCDLMLPYMYVTAAPCPLRYCFATLLCNTSSHAGRDPKAFPPPMKLCAPMVEAMGGSDSPYYRHFRTYCCEAYNILRKSATLILSLFHLMAGAAIPDVRQDPEKAMLKLQVCPLPHIANPPAPASPPPLLFALCFAGPKSGEGHAQAAGLSLRHTHPLPLTPNTSCFALLSWPQLGHWLCSSCRSCTCPSLLC